jgi:two-component system clock-associated histidine kinase SasA
VQANPSSATLQVLLFIDDRPSTREIVREVEQFIKADSSCTVDLQVIDVKAQPQLAELFRVVFTPALIKIKPAPRQTIAGKNLVSQLKTVWLDWQKQTLNGESGDLAELSDRLNYTTELIKLADEVFRLKQEIAQLKEQNYFQERVMAMLAHDLRGPLTAISLALETLELSGDKISQPQVQQMLNQARKQTKVADTMIVDILEGGQLLIKPQRLQIGELCDRITEDLYITNSLKAKNQELIKDIPPDLPTVYGDEERIRQVLINLLENASKYTPENGRISLTLMHRTAQKVEVSVTDTGLGVPPELRERIFEERFRLERDEKQWGYGIGLALCRRIIRAHYGQIWVESDGSSGSSFRFTLPVF